jgi:hypothetical protein
MKRLFTAVLILTVCFAVAGFGQAKKWQFVKVFPDTATSFGTGLHGIAIDPDGKIWVGPASTQVGKDTLPNGRLTIPIYVYNQNGTQAAYSPIKIITTPGAADTLTGLCRGMRTMPNGNIAYVGIGGQVFELNYKTGAGVRKVNPYSPSVVAGIAPAFTSAGEMFTGPVLPGNPIKILDNTFAGLGTAVAASVGFSRTLEVSKDGNNIYWCGYSNKAVYVYHSDIGTLGTYTLVDSTFGKGMQVESSGWGKGTQAGLLYLSAGTNDTTDYGNPPVDPPWKQMTWYAFNTTTKQQVDSLTWNTAAYPYPLTNGALMPRPRGHDFTASGDTIFVICYNHAKAAMQMFRRVVTSVEPVSEAVPNNYTLSQNFPNPFNPSTQIEFSVPKEGFTTVKVYDMLGKEVVTLVNEQLNPGTYRTTLDGTKLSSGTYVYMLTSGSTRITKKMMLVK